MKILEAVTTKSRAAVAVDNGLDIEEIANRAYEIYVERGKTHGNDVDDWLQAEHDVEQKHANSTQFRPTAAR